jgi:D-glycero-D-manno-heptose 1,7-bisphosphate phosphatase
MTSVQPPFHDRRLGNDLLWRDVRVERFPRPTAALFLDRDGVIIEEYGYVSRPEQVELLPGVPELIRAARSLGMAVVEVTNQAGIGRGYYDWPDFIQVEDRVTELLAGQGVSVDAVFACPFHSAGVDPYRIEDHPWRKPNPGMLLEAASGLNLALEQSILAGDKDSDQRTARAAKLKCGIHLFTGYGREQETAARAAGSGAFPVPVFEYAGQAAEALRKLAAPRTKDRACAFS